MNNRNRVRKHRNQHQSKKMHRDQINKRVKKIILEQNKCDETNNYEQINKQADRDISSEFKVKLRIWVVNHRITQTALNDLLLILISAGFCFLPKDARTLMATPTNVPIDILSNGKLWFYGIRKCLENTFAEIRRSIEITLDFDFDGLPISKSSSKQFWPILSSIRG